MSITITLPETLGPLLDQQVERLGYTDTGAHLSALVREDAARNPSAELEAFLIEALDAPGFTLDQAAADALIADTDAIIDRYVTQRPA